VYTTLIENLKGRANLGRLGVDYRMLWKWMVALSRVYWCSGVEEDQLSNYQLLKANPFFFFFNTTAPYIWLSLPS
jgi:hypothetical protein